MNDESHVNQYNKNSTNTIDKQSFPKKNPKKHKYDYTNWFSDKFNHVRGENALWAAVITQALMDALSRSRNSEMLYHKHEAIRWLTDNSKDFIEVCLHAGMDPDYIRRNAKRCLLAPSPWRAAPGQGKRYLERKKYRARKKNKPRPMKEISNHADDQHSGPAQIIAGPW